MGVGGRGGEPHGNRRKSGPEEGSTETFKWGQSWEEKETVPLLPGVFQTCPFPWMGVPTSAPTFEGRLQDGGWFGRQEELLGVAAEGPALLRRHDELPGEACAVTDVIVLVVLGQAQHVLGQQLGLGNKRG